MVLTDSFKKMMDSIKNFVTCLQMKYSLAEIIFFSHCSSVLDDGLKYAYLLIYICK